MVSYRQSLKKACKVLATLGIVALLFVGILGK